MVVVVVVCMGLLFTVLTVGVLRLRAAHKRALREEAEVEMAWDDAALNITVNPLEVKDCCTELHTNQLTLALDFLCRPLNRRKVELGPIISVIKVIKVVSWHPNSLLFPALAFKIL